MNTRNFYGRNRENGNEVTSDNLKNADAVVCDTAELKEGQKNYFKEAFLCK